MVDKARLKVVLCWHMHQPEYRDLINGTYQLPWTYLHAIKDYVDMAAILEANPAARAVVNFVPILLDQIEDYAAQVTGFLTDSAAIRDPLLAAVDMPALPVRQEERIALIKACLRVNEQRVINRFAPYRKLVDMAQWMEDKADLVAYLGEQYLVDLLVWYHIGWLGETVRRDNPHIQALMEKGQGFSLHDRRQLMEVIGALLAGIIGRYRRLAEAGQVELSVTPYAHPMLPLLQDIGCAKEAMPEIHLPALSAYPGGEERAHWHMTAAKASFERHFGLTPQGCWPSEGGVSTATLKLLREHGFAWAASGEGVLQNSLMAAHGEQGASEGNDLPGPYRVGGEDGIACFFRDDGLSDLIGFTYTDWHADDAVNNLIHHLEKINKHCGENCQDNVISIILDGENAWEYYPENAYHFLTGLYARLTEHPQLELTTFSDCLKDGVKPMDLPAVVGGSWVYGSFSTWVGHADKNRGWDVLAEAKHAFDRAIKSGYLVGKLREAAERQLAVCEGSDWFWWFGDDKPADSVSDFEHLFRRHIANLYQMVGEEPPEYLTEAISHGGGKAQHGGVMLPGQAK